MLHKYDGPAHESDGRIVDVWTKCYRRVEPWDARYRWIDVKCDDCLAHPDHCIAVAKKRKKVQ